MFSSEYFGFSLAVSIHQCSILILIIVLILSEWQTGEAWEPSNKAMHFPISGNIWREKYFETVLCFMLERVNELVFPLSDTPQEEQQKQVERDTVFGNCSMPEYVFYV